MRMLLDSPSLYSNVHQTLVWESLLLCRGYCCCLPCLVLPLLVVGKKGVAALTALVVVGSVSERSPLYGSVSRLLSLLVVVVCVVVGELSLVWLFSLSILSGLSFYCSSCFRL